MYRLWGRVPGQEKSFESFLATVPIEDRKTLVEVAARLHRNGERFCLDFRASIGDGSRRWFRGRGQRLVDELGRPVKLVGTVQDVTEEKEAEENLRTAKELYQQIVETAHEGIVMIDTESTATFVNRRFAQMLGYSVEDMLGMPSSAFVDEQALPSLARHHQARRAGLSEHYETTLRAKDGALLHALISASPLLDTGGRYCGALAMVTDVTALREANEVLRLQSAGARGNSDGRSNHD